jgi:hypothetical protein
VLWNKPDLARDRRFADSPLEERVSSEPVSEVGFSGPGNYGIPRGLWMITEAEKGYSGLENGGISVFALGSFSGYLDPKLLITLSVSAVSGFSRR